MEKKIKPTHICAYCHHETFNNEEVGKHCVNCGLVIEAFNNPLSQWGMRNQKKIIAFSKLALVFSVIIAALALMGAFILLAPLIKSLG